MSLVVQEATATGLCRGLIVRSVGKKVLMAVSGVIALCFVTGHMVGNLQVFMGPDQLNTYAETLHRMGSAIWIIRLSLLAVFIVHIYMGVQLKLENLASRPVGYNRTDTVKATLASRTMIWTGLIVFAFVVYHLLHFTVRTTNPEFQTLVDSAGKADVYSMVIIGFQNYLVSAFYIIAVGLLCYHLSHGIASMFQSIGWTGPASLERLDKMATIVAILLWLGYISIPMSVLSGLLTLPERGV
jgi:succinate dehydrogenase / fumarate reductase cytochrome b subunit